MKFQTEIVYLSALFNPKIYHALITVVNDMPWSTELALKVTSTTDKYCEWNDTTINTVLEPILVPEELNSFVESVHKYREVINPEDIQSISKTIFEFYVNQRFSKVLEYNSDNIPKLINETKKLPTELKTPIEPIPLGSNSASEVIQKELGSLDRLFNTTLSIVKDASPFRAYIPGQVVMWVSKPGSGKTAAMLQEVLFNLDNYKVLWWAIGDMLQIDFIARATSVLTGIPYAKVVTNPDKYFDDNIRKLLNNLHIVFKPSKTITAQEIANYVNNSPEYYDMVVIDYDANIATSNDNMYEAGGELYDVLSSIARPENGDLARLVFVASQPKVQYYNEIKIPLDGAAESSRKQHAADMMITMGHAESHALAAGMMGIVKNRRGDKDIYQPFTMENNGRIKIITQSQFNTLRIYS